MSQGAAACCRVPMSRLWPVLLPELRRIPDADRARALDAARATALDLLELVGMAAGLVVVSALTRHLLAGTSVAERFGTTIANFVVAIPLLVIALGPFHVRRLRRGLRAGLGTGGAK